VLGSGSRSDGIYEQFFRRLLALPSLHALAYVDEPFSVYSASIAKGRKKLVYVPDAASVGATQADRDEIRRRLGVQEGSVLVLAYGVMTERKGLMELILATIDDRVPTNVCLLLAGEQDQYVRRTLQRCEAVRLRRERRLFEMNRFLDYAEEAEVFAAADVVWMGYKNFSGSSGVLINAAAMGRPTISCAGGVIGWMTLKYDLGEIVNISSSEQVVGALMRLAGSEQIRSAYALNAAEVGRRHTGYRFGETICNAISNAE
jgi:glycosyltransferase involved in cell wall biosynthesis